MTLSLLGAFVTKNDDLFMMKHVLLKSIFRILNTQLDNKNKNTAVYVK